MVTPWLRGLQTKLRKKGERAVRRKILRPVPDNDRSALAIQTAMASRQSPNFIAKCSRAKMAQQAISGRQPQRTSAVIDRLGALSCRQVRSARLRNFGATVSIVSNRCRP
jgi:hypothetical protein